jgi:hypothetical protein
MVIFHFLIKGTSSPTGFLGFLSMKLATIVELLDIAYSPIPPMIPLQIFRPLKDDI